MREAVQDGADLSETGAEGRTALHLAALLGHDRIVGELVRAGMAVESVDANKRSPLHASAGAGHAAIGSGMGWWSSR